MIIWHDFVFNGMIFYLIQKESQKTWYPTTSDFKMLTFLQKYTDSIHHDLIIYTSSYFRIASGATRLDTQPIKRTCSLLSLGFSWYYYLN